MLIVTMFALSPPSSVTRSRRMSYSASWHAQTMLPAPAQVVSSQRTLKLAKGMQSAGPAGGVGDTTIVGVIMEARHVRHGLRAGVRKPPEVGDEHGCRVGGHYPAFLNSSCMIPGNVRLPSSCPAHRK